MAISKSSRTKLVVLLVLGVWTQSCYYDNQQDLYHPSPLECASVSAKFATDVMPIITSNCATPSCHNSTGVAGVVLQNYAQVQAKVDRIKQRTLIDKTMPPNGALTPSELSIIQCWITAGALNN